MEKIIVNGRKNGQKIEIACSNLVMGAGDFLRADNMDFAGPVLDQYFEMGGNIFDTARHYRHSEKAIGAWMNMRGNRDSVIIQTKGGHQFGKQATCRGLLRKQFTKIFRLV